MILKKARFILSRIYLTTPRILFIEVILNSFFFFFIKIDEERNFDNTYDVEYEQIHQNN